jgi:phosphohistidine phosphatase
MDRLILFRHAKAEPRAPGGEDFDRPLAESGRRDAHAVGELLAREAVIPDLALVSDAVRTRETWDCVSAAFPDARAEMLEALYNATGGEIAASLEEAAGSAQTVMIVGHNPGLQEYGVTLLIEGGAPPHDIEAMAASLPTATAVAFVFDAAGRAAFDGRWGPRDAAARQAALGTRGKGR